MTPMTTKNSTGDNMQPCLTPLPTTKDAERVPLCSTLHLAPLYVDLVTDTIFPFSQCHLEALSIHANHAVKGLFKVYKNQMQIGTVFSTLLDDYRHHDHVVNARRSSSEACLLTIYGGIKMFAASRPLCDSRHISLA